MQEACLASELLMVILFSKPQCPMVMAQWHNERRNYAMRPVHYFQLYRCVCLVLYLVVSIERREHPEHHDLKISGSAKRYESRS